MRNHTNSTQDYYDFVTGSYQRSTNIQVAPARRSSLNFMFTNKLYRSNTLRQTCIVVNIYVVSFKIDTIPLLQVMQLSN